LHICSWWHCCWIVIIYSARHSHCQRCAARYLRATYAMWFIFQLSFTVVSDVTMRWRFISSTRAVRRTPECNVQRRNPFRWYAKSIFNRFDRIGLGALVRSPARRFSPGSSLPRPYVCSYNTRAGTYLPRGASTQVVNNYNPTWTWRRDYTHRIITVWFSNIFPLTPPSTSSPSTGTFFKYARNIIFYSTFVRVYNIANTPVSYSLFVSRVLYAIRQIENYIVPANSKSSILSLRCGAVERVFDGSNGP